VITLDFDAEFRKDAAVLPSIGRHGEHGRNLMKKSILAVAAAAVMLSASSFAVQAAGKTIADLPGRALED
jgi:hypothetical protein